MSKFVQKYGNNIFYRDSSFKRQQRCKIAHENITVFNYYSGGPCCHGGGFGGFMGWTGSFLQNLGCGFGFGLFSGLFGGFRNMCPWAFTGYGDNIGLMGLMSNSFSWAPPFVDYEKTKKEDDVKVIGDGGKSKKEVSVNNEKPEVTPPVDQTPPNSAVTENDNSPVNEDDDYSGCQSLTPEDKNTLKSLGVKIKDLPYNNPNNKAFSLPNNMTAENLKKLAEIANRYDIPIAVANNPSATEDQWIAGKIGNIDNDEGTLSYTIDCNGVGTYGYSYNVVSTEEGKYQITCITPEAELEKNNHVAEETCVYEYKNGVLHRNQTPSNVHH